MKTAPLIVPAGDILLEVTVSGQSDRPAIVWLHGFPETAAMWDRLSADLVSLGYRSVAPNQRGYGASSRPDSLEGYDLDALVDDVIALTAALGHRRYLVVGHDWGAAIGWRLAARAPMGLLGVIAISAPDPAIWRHFLRSDPDQRARSLYLRLFRMPWLPELLLRATGFKALERGFRRIDVEHALIDDYRRAWRRPGALTGMLNWYRAFLSGKPAPFPPSPPRVPLLFVRGDADPFMAPATALASAELLPDSDTILLSGGHWLVHTQRAAIGALVHGFAQRVGL